jgi:hypothetical protein
MGRRITVFRRRVKTGLDELLLWCREDCGPDFEAAVAALPGLASHPVVSGFLRASTADLLRAVAGWRAVWPRPWGVQLHAGLVLRPRPLIARDRAMPDIRHSFLALDLVRVAVIYAWFAARAAKRTRAEALAAADRWLARLMLCGEDWRGATRASGYREWAARFLAVRLPELGPPPCEADYYLHHLLPFQLFPQFFPDQPRWGLFGPLFSAAVFAHAAASGRGVLGAADVVGGFAAVTAALSLAPEKFFALAPLEGVPELDPEQFSAGETAPAAKRG